MILITGATGNVGRNVVEQLLVAGQRVRAMTRDPASARLPAGVEVVRGDLTDPETLPAALEGIDRAYLFPVSGHLQPFLGLGRAQGLKRVVLLSSSSASDPSGALGQVHAANESVVRASGLPWTFVRPTAFMANDLRWAGQIKTTSIVRAPYGHSTTAPIDERDIAAVVAAALTQDGHEGRAYSLTGPQSLSVVERVRILAQVLGRDITFEELPPERARQFMPAAPPAIADNLLAMMAKNAGRPAQLTEDVERATGRPPFAYRQWATRHAPDLTG